MAAGNRGGKRLVNRAPRWALEALEHLGENPPDGPQPTSWFRTFCLQWREDHMDRYESLRWPPRDFDGTNNDYAALLRRLGWRNLKAGTGRPAMW